jgi:hypothetical protein
VGVVNKEVLNLLVCGKYVFSGSSTDQDSGECSMMAGGKARSASKLKYVSIRYLNYISHKNTPTFYFFRSNIFIFFLRVTEAVLMTNVINNIW